MEIRKLFDLGCALQKIGECFQVRDDMAATIIPSKLEQAKACLDEAITEVTPDLPEHASPWFCEIGSAIHTALRKHYDDKASCVLYNAIHKYGKAWSLFLLYLEGIARTNDDCKYPSTVAFYLALQRMEYGLEVYGSFEFRCAMDYFALAHSTPDEGGFTCLIKDLQGFQILPEDLSEGWFANDPKKGKVDKKGDGDEEE